MHCINFSDVLKVGSYVYDDSNTELEVLSIKELPSGQSLVTLLEIINYPPRYDVEPDYALHLAYV